MPTFSPWRGISRSFLPRLVKLNLSANKSYDYLHEVGLKVRRQDFLRDFKEFKHLKDLKETFKYIPGSRKPTMGTITTTEESLTKTYSYIFDIEGKDSLTGRDKFIHWRHATDDLIVLDEAKDIIERYMKENKYSQDIKDYTINVTGVLKSTVL